MAAHDPGNDHDLITGATGKTGRECLRARHKSVEFRAASNDPAPPPGPGRGEYQALRGRATRRRRARVRPEPQYVPPTCQASAPRRPAPSPPPRPPGCPRRAPSSATSWRPRPAMGRWHHQREEIVRGYRQSPPRPAAPVASCPMPSTGVPPSAQAGYVSTQDRPAAHRRPPAPPSPPPGRPSVYVPTGTSSSPWLIVQSSAAATGLDIRPARRRRPPRPRGPLPPLGAEALPSHHGGHSHERADTVGFLTDTVERLLGRRPGPSPTGARAMRRLPAARDRRPRPRRAGRGRVRT